MSNHQGSLEKSPGWLIEGSIPHTEWGISVVDLLRRDSQLLVQGWALMGSSSQDDAIIQSFIQKSRSPCRAVLLLWLYVHINICQSCNSYTPMYCYHPGHHVSTYMGFRGTEGSANHSCLKSCTALAPAIQLQMSVRCV